MESFDHILIYGVTLAVLLAIAGWLVFRQRRLTARLTVLLAEQDVALNNANQRLSQVTSQLAQLANTDPVTHLLVRHVVVERFQLLRTQARRYGTKFGIVLIALTDFDHLSDQIGKDAGDNLLASLGSRLLAMTREADTVGFLRDQDFAVLMPNVDSVAGLDGMVSRLRAALAVPFSLPGVAQSVCPEIYFGKAMYPENGDDWTSILQAADNDLLFDRSRPGVAERHDAPETPAQRQEPHAGRHGWEEPAKIPAHLWDALVTLGLGWPVTLEAAGNRYKELAEREHPDANGSSHEAEERQNNLNAAYTAVRSALEARVLEQ